MASDLLWADPQDRTVAAASTHRKALKRHIYVKEGSELVRRCGATGMSNRSTVTEDDLMRVEPEEFAADVNACDNCLSYSNLEDVAQNARSGGAEEVDYDPFGVFTDE